MQQIRDNKYRKLQTIFEYFLVIEQIRTAMTLDMKKIYQYAFVFAKSPEQKSLTLETAIAFWDILLPKFKYLEAWKEFLNLNWGKSISKDTWNLFYDFQNGFSKFQDHDFDGN